MANEVIAVDVETTGLDPFKGDYPFCITIYSESRGGVYYDLSSEDQKKEARGILFDPSIDKVFHNAKFDILMLNGIGININGNIHDTMIMAHIYNSEEESKKLKKLAEKYLGVEPLNEQELKRYMRKHEIDNYKDIPIDILKPYAINDAEITYGLFEFYRKAEIDKDITYRAELRLLHCLIKMQKRGVLIDTEFCRREEKILEERIEEILDIIQKEYGDININSPKQLASFLFEEEGLACNKTTATGSPSLDRHSIETYDHPIIPLITEHRDISKILKTYIKGLTEQCDDNDVIHCDFFQVGAKTGRFSCRTPNLQNIPRGGSHNVRKAFICRPGYRNYYYDYSQIELRLFAHYSKEEAMIEELLKEDGDLHAMTALKLFSEVTNEYRRIAKSLNFGIIYGIGAARFAETLNKEFPNQGYNYNLAKKFISRYYRAYPNISKFVNKVKRAVLNRTVSFDDGSRYGYVNDVFGRRYLCPKDKTYKAVNYLIQGCAAGVIKSKMLLVSKYLEGKRSNLLMTIHDELVIEIHESEDYVADTIVRIMEDRETFRVPLTVNVESTSTSWADKSKVDMNATA